MKKIFLGLTVSIFLFGCSKDDDTSDNDTSGSMIGVWKLVESSSGNEGGYIEAVTGDEIVTYSIPLSIDDQHPLWKQYWIFTYDNRFSQYFYYYTVEDLTISVEDSIWIGGVSSQGDYVRDGYLLSFIYNEGPAFPDSYQKNNLIITLTDSDFIYSWNDYQEWYHNDTLLFHTHSELYELVKSELP